MRYIKILLSLIYKWEKGKNKSMNHVYALYAILTHLCSCTLVTYTWKEKNDSRIEWNRGCWYERKSHRHRKKES